MSKYDMLSDDEIDQLIDKAYQRGWTACLDELQKAQLEKEGKDVPHPS